MSNFPTYHSLLLNAAQLHPDKSAFKIPQKGSPKFVWRTITYSQIVLDIEDASRYWHHELSARGCESRSVIGLWLKGTTYSDFLTIWGLVRAGFIPQLISIRLNNPAVVFEMLASAKATALVHDELGSDALSQSQSNLPLLPVVDHEVTDANHLPLPDLWAPSEPTDIFMIYHTSGSTAGIPKLVPMTAKWFKSALDKGAEIGSVGSRQTVSILIGSLTHLGSFLNVVDVIWKYGCLIIPHELPYSIPELQSMIQDAGLTDLFMFGVFLSKILAEARTNTSLLGDLRRLDLFQYGGLPVDPAAEVWARSQGLRIKNNFGSTEVGLLLVSDPDSSAGSTILKPSSISNYELIPLASEGDTGTDEQLVEFVLLPESPDCPHPSLCDPVTGKFHTGDLFVEIAPGQLVNRGRNDDWIKMERALRCDTGSLEQNALDTCGHDLISAAVVCGVGRPSPVMFIEPKEHETDTKDLKKEVLQRITPFHERRYDHERIEHERFIFVKPKGTLPRTAKGSIQRKLVEAAFKEEIIQVY